MTENIIFYYHSSTSPGTTIVALAIISVVMILGYYFSRRAIVLRALRKEGMKKIRDFSDGDKGKIIGRVVFAGQTINAPLSNRRCVYYHVIVEQHHSGKGGGHWSKVVEEKNFGDVVVNDGSGFAIVDVNDDMDYLVPDRNYSSPEENAVSGSQELFARNNFDPMGFFGLKTLRYSEAILEENEMFAVLGEGQWNEAKDHNLKLPSAKVLVIVRSKDEKVFLSDDPEAVQGRVVQ